MPSLRVPSWRASVGQPTMSNCINGLTHATRTLGHMGLRGSCRPRLEQPHE